MDEQFSPQVGIRKIEPSVQGPIPGSSSLHNFSGRMGRVSEQARTRSQSAQTTESWISRFLQGLSTVSLFMIFFGFPLFFLSGTLQGIVFEKQMYFYFWLLLGLIGWVSRGIVTGELRVIPNGAYQLTARAINGKYKNNINLRFSFIPGNLLGLKGVFKSPHLKKSSRGRPYLYPSISIRSKEGGIIYE